MKLSKSLFAMLILGVLATPISFLSPVKAIAEVDILNHTGYLDSFGYYRVVGEVKNVGDQAVRFINIEATFYNSSDVIVDTRFDLTFLYVLLVGRKSPFHIALLDTAQSAKVDHYSLNLTFSNTIPIPLGLEILSNTSYIDDGEYMHIVGEIKNTASEEATAVKVIATYYDVAGNVVAAELAYLDPEQQIIMDPGQTEPFEILLEDEDRISYVDRYELTAESLQYALVPEFPTWTSLLILLVVLTATITICIRARKKKEMGRSTLMRSFSHAGKVLVVTNCNAHAGIAM